jgi:2'-5' RNA ligase
VLDEVEAIVAPLRASRSVRWTAREMWHVTTAFYGEVDPADVDDLTLRLEQAAMRTQPADVHLNNGTEFNGRVLALEVAGDVEQLRVLADRCLAAGRAIGLPLERRRYRPHLTVARTGSRTPLAPLVDALLGARTQGWATDELVLVRSHLGDTPRYEVLGRFTIGH